MGRDKGGPVALTGVAFLVLALLGFVIGGEPPDAGSDTAQEIVDFYVDNEGALGVASFIVAAAAVLLVIFGAFLRDVLRDAEAGSDFLPTVAFAGTLILATGFAIDATINLALTETADDIEPSAAEALSALFNNDYIPFAVGSILFLAGLGLSALRSGVLPKWLAWAAVVLAVIGLTPLGFAAFIGSGILIAVVGVMLAMRGRRTPAAGSPGGGIDQSSGAA